MDERGYGIAGGATGKLSDTKPETPLDRVGAFADRVDRIAELVARFNSRFYSDPGAGDSAKSIKPVPSGYMGQIERLGNAVDDLDKVVQRLCEIG